MKTIKTIKTILLATVICSQIYASGGGYRNKNNNSHLENNDKVEQKVNEKIGLIIYGKVSNANISYKKVEFKLYESNEMVVTGTLNRKGEFEVPVYFDQNYVLEINTDGYLPKRLYFNTGYSQEMKKIEPFVFGFKIELVKKEMVEGADTYYLDFPYALVSYNDEINEFDYDKKYSDEMKEDEINAKFYSFISYKE